MTKIMGLGVDLGEEQKKENKGIRMIWQTVELQILNWKVGGVAGTRREGGEEVKKFLIRETVKIQYENK